MNKEKKQTTLTGMISNLEKEAKEGMIGIITEINEITNDKFFGEEGMYGEKNGYALTIQIRDDNKTEFSQWFSKPGIRGYKQSNMYAFYKKYGKEPTIGMQIDCVIDETGFFRVAI